MGNGNHLGLTHVEYIIQDEPLGLAHALGCALPWVEGDDVLMYLGDNLVKDGVADVVSDFKLHGPNAQILLTKVPNPSAFGVAELDSEGTVIRLVEKPAAPKSDLALVGVYLFDSKIGDAIDSIRPSARGELEITDAIQYLVDEGFNVHATQVTGWWKDTGHKQDLLHANELVLRGRDADIAGELIDSEIRGSVTLSTGARVIDSQITGPATIGSGSTLIRTKIGPNTAIGADTTVSDASVENSIIMNDVQVHGLNMRNSLVGQHCILKTEPGRGWAEITLGQGSVIIEE